MRRPSLARAAAALLLALALPGCSKASGPAATSGTDDVAAFMKLDGDKAVAFAAGGTDCAAKATAVGAWRSAHSATYKALQAKLNAQWASGPPKEVLATYGVQMKANKAAVMDAMFACSSDATFAKMMDATEAK